MIGYTIDENLALVEDARRRVSTRAASELGILFAYHRLGPVVERNLGSLSELNSDATVIPIATTEGLNVSSGFWAYDNRFWFNLTGGLDSKLSWYNLDALYYEYYRRRNDNCKRWLLAEWDVFCNGSIKDYFGSLWDAPFVSTDIHEKGSGWFWFCDTDKMPNDVRKFATGLSPLAGTLISDAALEKIVLNSWWIDRPVFCELRLGTIARFSGVEMFPNPNGRGKVIWRPKPIIEGKGLWHPMKD